MEDREQQLRQKRVKRRKNELIMKCVICLLVLIIVFLGVILIKDALLPGISGANKAQPGKNARLIQEKFEREEAEKAAAELGRALEDRKSVV